MLGGNAEVEAHNEEDFFRNMSPVDQLKFERELATKREYTPAEASKNIEDALTGLAYSTPGVANAMSIRDAYEAKERASKSEPGSRERQQAEAESAMSALSAFLPFSLGKPSPGSASRFGVFAGPAAKTADMDALEQARILENAGAPRKQILEKTGWFRDTDSRWKFEIDDSKATVKDKGGATVADYLDHPELERAYPQLFETDVRQSSFPGMNAFSGSYSSKLPPSLVLDPYGIKKPVVLHELDHAVQDIEDFGRGGGIFDPDYFRLKGEVSARNVEERMNMTAAERRAKPPWETQDVPDDQQVVSTVPPGRQNVFVPVKDEAVITKSRNIFDDMVDSNSLKDTNERIWEDTRTLFGAEGSLKREIPDYNMVIKQEGRPGETYRLDQVIEHPEVFEAYPELRTHPVKFTGKSNEYGNVAARTEDDGTFMLSAGLDEQSQRVQLSKLIQYTIDPKAGFAAASRKTAAHNIADAESAIDRVRSLISDGRVDSAAGERYVQSLRDAIQESKAIRAGTSDSSGGDFTLSKHRRNKEKSFWERRSAGKQQAKTVKYRTYHELDNYPYSRVQLPLEDQIAIPPRDLTSAALARFIENWKNYGAGRSKK